MMANLLAAGGASINVDLGKSLAKPSDSLLIILAITLLGVAPSLLILLTGFTRIIIVLSLTRQALGLQSTPPNQVIAGLALVLSLFIMTPTLKQMNTQALQPYLNGKTTLPVAITNAEGPLKVWMLKQTGTSELALTTAALNDPTPATSPTTTPSAAGAATGAAATPVTTTPVTSTPSTTPTSTTGSGATGSSTTGSGSKSASKTEPPNVNNTSMAALVPAFMLSQLKAGFIIGFVIFIPFLIIDLVVASVLMSLGMAMLPPTLISLPFKLLLFVMVNGWVLVTHSLLVSFR